eukprot:scaffold16421_cov51-Attheya_sp.AAC.5
MPELQKYWCTSPRSQRGISPVSRIPSMSNTSYKSDNIVIPIELFHRPPILFKGMSNVDDEQMSRARSYS